MPISVFDNELCDLCYYIVHLRLEIVSRYDNVCADNNDFEHDHRKGK